MNRLAALQLAVTAFVLAASLVEAIVLHRRRPGTFDWGEAGLSLADMVGRRLLATLPLNLAAPVFTWVWHHRLATVELQGVAAFAVLFLGLEFFYYWYHRAAHRVRFFWATHLVHHSPNQISLSTAFRLGWTGKMTGTTLFFTPLVLIGFQPQVVLSALTLNLLYQFWLHTTWIPKLGWLEGVLNTPSSHRVHHASNLRYLDANYGGVLVVFDRLFGTYVEEDENEPCVFGLVHPIHTRNILTLEFHEWLALWRDVRAARSLAQAAGHLLMPPGWAPDGRGQTTEDLRALAATATPRCDAAGLTHAAPGGIGPR